MQTLEQAMLELVRHGKITTEAALNRSSRPDQLKGLLQRNGLILDAAAEAGNLRVAGT
jgi:Tfp pilus assembly ATPase PilU